MQNSWKWPELSAYDVGVSVIIIVILDTTYRAEIRRGHAPHLALGLAPAQPVQVRIFSLRLSPSPPEQNVGFSQDRAIVSEQGTLDNRQLTGHDATNRERIGPAIFKILLFVDCHVTKQNWCLFEIM